MHEKNDAKTRLQVKPFSKAIFEVLEVKNLTFWSLWELRNVIWRPGKARQGEARRGKATRGEARRGEARPGEARRGRSSCLGISVDREGTAPVVRGSLPRGLGSRS